MSDRTSVHIHLDVRDLDQEELFNLLTLYLTFEKPLYRFSGDRSDNIFCLPYYSADFHIPRVYNILEARSFRDIHGSLRNFNKYSGLNLASILDRGSLEFRHMKGTLSYNRIIQWINIIMALKKFSRECSYEYVLSLPENMSSEGFDKVANDVFGDLSKKLMNYPNVDKEILEGIRVAQDALDGKKLGDWVKNHIPNDDTGISPRFHQAARNLDIDLGLFEDLSHQPQRAYNQVFGFN